MHHLAKRRSDQAAQSDEVDIELTGFGHNLLSGHHHAEVDDLIVVAGENHTDDILSDVVDITLNSSQQHTTGSSSSLLFLCLDIRLKDSNGLLHRAGGLHHLGKKHLTGSEQRPYLVHTVHQRSFDDVDSMRILLKRLVEIGIHIFSNTFSQGIAQAALHTLLAPGLVRDSHSLATQRSSKFGSFLLGTFLFGQLHQVLGSTLPTVENDIFDNGQLIGGYISVGHLGSRIDNAEIHTLLNGMIEEHGVHGFTDVVDTTE